MTADSHRIVVRLSGQPFERIEEVEAELHARVKRLWLAQIDEALAAKRSTENDT